MSKNNNGGNNIVQSFINRANKHRDIYHDLMPFKVKEILLVSHLYDAYLIEGEGRFSEIMLYEYGHLNLSSLPRITGASFDEDVCKHFIKRNIDLVILMVGLDKFQPLELAKDIKEKYPDKPIFILLHDRTHEKYFVKKLHTGFFDMIFEWNGETKIFFAMIKYLEDKMNAKNDTKIGSVRLILLVEDKPIYYSAFLSSIYKIIFDQTNKVIEEISTDSAFKVLKLRIRPKVILARNYEDAITLFNEYKDYLYCLLTDVRFEKNNKIDVNAGFKLIEEIKKQKKEMPIIVISSENRAKDKAKELNVEFIHKYTEFLNKELRKKVVHNLNFGDFIFKDQKGHKIGKAKSIKQFKELIKTVSDETIMYHAHKDDFSQWLLARSEILLAKILNLKKTSDFTSPMEIRDFLLNTIKNYADEKAQGNVLPIGDEQCNAEGNIISLFNGAYGGKGRGLTFANSLFNQFNVENKFSDIDIKLPKTAVIGVKEYEEFITNIDLDVSNNRIPSYKEVKQKFLANELSDLLQDRLKKLLKCFTKPLAIRSSGSFEDSLSRPFAGIFETYVIPNNHEDPVVRLKQIQDAIKLVFASVFSEKALNYAKALDQRIEEQQMAIVIQELVGNEYNGLYYPHISGVAQSYNFYPFANMQPEDGFSVIAFGLGMYVVNGENAYRFSPKHPQIQVLSFEDQIKHTQTYYYALDINKKDYDLSKGAMETIKKVDIYDARSHNTLTHCVSVYDVNNLRLYPGAHRQGPLVVNFPSILKTEYIPLANVLNYLLNIFEKSFGTPVEIEFAVDLNPKPTFYLLQVKPLIKAVKDYSINPGDIVREKAILYSEKIMGNGKIDFLKDIVFVKPDTFDNTKTNEMVNEISSINDTIVQDGKQYVLIGPGRWGTRDRFLGIPVTWPQISGAKVIVETDLDGFPLDASYGSHFFHNLTSLNIAYFSIVTGDNSFLNLDLLDNIDIIQETKYFKHIRFKEPFTIKMDGKKRLAVIEIK